MKHTGLILLCLGICLTTTGQNFPVNAIADSLTRNANAVVRLSDRTLTVKSASAMVLDAHEVVTILNKQGETKGEFTLCYDKRVKPSDIKIVIYDAAGHILKKVKNDEIKDYSSNDESSIFTDDRVRYYKPVTGTFPYTVDISYTLRYDGFASLPFWIPVSGYNVSIENATFELKSGQDVSIRYKTINLPPDSNSGNPVRPDGLRWQITGFCALEDEPYSPEKHEVFPAVMLSCDLFEYEGSKGSMSSWEEYGRWIATLLEGRRELPEATIQKVTAITAPLQTKREKATVLYEYLQQRMRYVSIQIGIGGLQPFKAADVDKWNYGDCKALTNYYLALLSAAGIDGLYAATISDEGNPRFYSDFPTGAYFNHVIAGVLLESDTVWTECTSSYFPFGFLSNSVAGHPAMIVSPAGGKLITLPGHSSGLSNEFRNTTINISDNGSAKINFTRRYTGWQLTTGLGFWTLSPDDQKKALYENIKYNDATINELNCRYQKVNLPFVEINASVDCQKFATVSDDRLFIPLTDAVAPIKVPAADPTRRFPLQILNSYTDADTLKIYFPEGYVVESLPKPFSTETEYGRFSFIVNADNNHADIISLTERLPVMFEAKNFESFRQFLLTINKAARQKIILKKKQL